MPKRSKYLAFLLVLLIAVFAAGCDPDQPKPPQPPGAVEPGKQPAPPAAETMRLTVYHATKDAAHLVPEVHTVAKSDHPAQSAVELLLAEPQNPELVRTLPEGTKLRSLTVKDHIAYADFSDRLVKGGKGGSASEILAVSAIVNTLTEFPDIYKVQILVEGRRIATLYGHLDTSEPLSRSEKIIKKPL
jgi:germination protein M